MFNHLFVTLLATCIVLGIVTYINTKSAEKQLTRLTYSLIWYLLVLANSLLIVMIILYLILQN